MRGVTPFFDCVIKRIKLWIAGCHTIDKQEDTTWFQDTRYFLDRLSDIGKMMSCNTAGDAVICLRAKWQLFRVSDGKGGGCHTLGKKKFARPLQHTWGQITYCDLSKAGGNYMFSMTAAGSKIQGLLIWMPFTHVAQA